LQRRGNFKRMLRPPSNTLALHGAVGCATARKSRSGPTLQGTQTPFKSTKSTSSDSAQDDTTRGARHPSELIPFLNTSQPLSRRTPSWWTQPKPTWDCGGQDKSNISPSVKSCVTSPEQILLPTEYGPSTLPYSSNSMLRAHRKCRKVYLGKVSFSEAADVPKCLLIFWQTAVRRRKGLKVCMLFLEFPTQPMSPKRRIRIMACTKAFTAGTYRFCQRPGKSNGRESP